MPGRTQIAMSAREHAMEVIRAEMSAFERREIAFRRKVRQERAAELRLPLNADEAPTGTA